MVGFVLELKYLIKWYFTIGCYTDPSLRFPFWNCKGNVRLVSYKVIVVGNYLYTVFPHIVSALE